MDFMISRRDALALLSGAAVAMNAPKAFAADKLRVGKAVAQVFGYIPLDIGMKYGFFEKQGLEIEEISFVSGSELAQAVTAGAIDITLSGGPDMAFTARARRARDRGSDDHDVAGFHGHRCRQPIDRANQ